MQPTGAWFDTFRSYPFDVFSGFAVKGAINTSYMRVLNSALGFIAPICPTIYLENHDHATIPMNSAHATAGSKRSHT